MKKLYINNVVSKEVEHIVSAAGIIDLFPKEVILQYNWLITDYSGDISILHSIEKKKNGKSLIWLSGHNLLDAIKDTYLYEGVLTGFLPSISLDDLLIFDSYPEWEGWNRDVDLPYVQNPLGSLELIIDDGSSYSVVTDDTDLLVYIEKHCKDIAVSDSCDERPDRSFGDLYSQQLLPTTVGNWWLTFNGEPISFKVIDGHSNFSSDYGESHPDWVSEIIGRFILLPNLKMIKGKGKLEIKTNLPRHSFRDFEIVSGERYYGAQYLLKKSANNLNFAVTQYYDDECFLKKSGGVYQLDRSDSGFPAYYIEGNQSPADLRFCLSWGALATADSLSLDVACDFDQEEIVQTFSN